MDPRRSFETSREAQVSAVGRFIEQVVIDQPLSVVFETLTDPAQLERIGEHITNVEVLSSGAMHIGSRWSQCNTIHGRAYPETVEVIELKPGRTFATRRNGAGVTVTFRYAFERVDDRRTRVTLVKEAKASGLGRFLLPLANHVMKKPEHDGRHLDYVKIAIEDRFPPRG